MDRIPQEDLERNRRKVARKIASSIIAAMSESDMSYSDIAARIEMTGREVQDFMDRLIAGDAGDLDAMSDLLLAMGYEMEFRLMQAEPLPPMKEQS